MAMLEQGDLVTHSQSGFTGTVITPHSGGKFVYYQDGKNLNIAVWAVADQHGEVRFFLSSSLVPAAD